MTESNDPTPPLSRMRFSWQRGTPPREGDAAPPREGDAAPPRTPEDDPPDTAGEQPAGAEQSDAPEVPFWAAPEPQSPEPPSPEAPGASVPLAGAEVAWQQPYAQDPAAPPAYAQGTSVPQGMQGQSATARAARAAQTARAGRASEAAQTSQPAHTSQPAQPPPAAQDSILGERFDLDETGRGHPGDAPSTHQWSARARRAARPGTPGAPVDAPAQPGDPAHTDTAGTTRDGRTTHDGRTTRDKSDKRDKSGKKDKRGKGGSAGAGKKTSSGDTFEVPKPGGRFSGGRGSHVGIRLALLLTACVLLLGITGYSTYTFGIASVRDDDYALSQQDIDRFGLTEFPEEQAGRFAADYARLCMTHTTDETAEEQRQQQISRYVSSGTDAGCGWSGTGKQQVTDASWTGASEPIQVQGFEGHARMMTVRVLTADGRRQMLSVPVYVENLDTGQGMRVVGDVGEMPQPLLVNPPDAEPLGEVDRELTEALRKDQFFQQFFEAWGSSDEPSLTRFVTPNATDRARAGLSDTLQRPRISDVEVFLPADADPVEHGWNQGDRTQAYVWVTWQHPSAGDSVTVTRAYRLELEMTEQSSASVAQGWAVHDVRGGVPSVDTE